MRRLALFFLLIGPQILASSAIAQPAPTAPASAAPAQDEADRLFREANELYKQKRFAEAEVVYEKAFAKKPAHDIASNLGYAEMYQNKLVEAAEHIAYSVRMWPPTGKDDKRQGAVERLAKVKADIATLTVEVNVAGARVLIGEREVGVSPLAAEVFADAGRVVVRAKRDGYRDAEQTIDAAKGSTLAVKLAMEAVAAAVVPTGTATATATASVTGTVVVVPRSKVPAIVLGGAAVIGIGVGAVLLGTAHATNADVSNKMPRDNNGHPLCQRPPVTGLDVSECNALRARTVEANTLGNVGVITVAGGGAAVAAAVLYLMWPSTGPVAAKLAGSFVPVVGRNGGGVVIQGTF